MNAFLGKLFSRLGSYTAVGFVLVTTLLVSGQAFAVPSMTSTLSTTSTTAGSKVDLTTQIPAVSAVDASTQEIIQTIDPSKVRLTSASDVIAPSGWTVTYSTDGTTFTATPSSWAAVVKVKATGVVNSGGATVDGKQIYSTTVSLPGTVTTVDGAARTGGDGYDTAFDSRGYIYNTYHHDYANGALDCRKRSDGSFCSASWPFGLASEGFHSNFSSTQYFDEVYKHLWLPVSDRLTGTGFLCIDVSTVETPVYCGGSKATAWHMVQSRANANEAGVTDIIASNGKVYSWDMLAPRVLCYDYLANNGLGAPCASMPTFSRLVAGTTRTTNNIPYTYSTFKVAYGNVYGELNGIAICFNGATMGKCTGWAEYDYVLGTNSVTKIMYVQPNAAGGIAGICSTADGQCFAENGSRFAANATVQAGLTQGWMSYWNGAVEAAGSKLLWTSYFDKPSTTYCYDYATSAPCANWTAATRFITGVGQLNTDAWRIYTLKVDPLSNDCMWTNGDLGQGIKQFTISTATPGCNINVSTVSFAQSAIQPRLACSFGADVKYSRFTIGGLSAGTDFSTASLTVVKANGSVAVSGGTTWSNIPFNSSGYVDLTNLAYADVGAGANFKVTYANRTTFTATTGTLTMETESAQLCLSVTANVACPTTTQIINLPTQIASFSATGSTTSSGGTRIDYSSTSPNLSIAPPASASACGFELTGLVAQGGKATAFPATPKPVAGAVATLLDSSGALINDANGNPITATSLADGTYSFGYLKAGTYKVRFGDLAAVNGVGAGDLAMVYISPYTYTTGQFTMTGQSTPNFATEQTPLASPAVSGVAGGDPVSVRATYIVRAVAVNDAISVKAGAASNALDVLANDSPSTNATFTKNTVKICAAGTTSACALTTLTVAGEGTYGINTTTGGLTFTPLANFTGVATAVNYGITDGLNPAQTVNASVVVTVVPAPTTAPDTLSGNLQAPITVDVTANDSPATGATLVKSSVKLCATGTTTNCAQTSVAIAGKGTYSVSALGIVTFTPETAYVGPVPALTYSITDSVGNVVTNTVTATVTPTPPTITTPAFPNAAVGLAMPTGNQTLTTGNAAIPTTGAWAVTVGVLPPGLTLNPDTGAITGTPTATGVYSFTVRVTDANGQTATKVETISVFVGPTITTTPTSYAYYAGTPMSITDTVTAGTGAILPSAAWSATGLPAGVTINTTTGVISGTPTTDGVYPVLVKVTDTNNLSDTETITITVTTKPVITTVSPLPRAIAGVAITEIPQTKTQGTASIPPTGAWAITAGALPAGLTFNPDTGAITGTATATGNFTFTVKLTDAAGEVATKVETISVISGPTITTNPLAYKVYNGTAATITNTFTLGTGALATPTAWTATGLPQGLSINPSTGVISGTVPSGIAGPYPVVVRVTDVNGLFDEETITITPTVKPIIQTSPALRSNVVGVAIVPEPQTYLQGSAQIPATGAWSITVGTLPSGLTLNPDTGEITGTPTAAGDFSFTVKLTDADGEYATRVETMRVIAGPDITTSPLTYMTNVNEPWSLTQTALRGTGNLLAANAWTFSALPEGLTANRTTGVISGIPTAIGSTDVTVTVTDVNGLSDTAVITIKVVEPPKITTPRNLGSFELGTSPAPIPQTVDLGSAPLIAHNPWTSVIGSAPIASVSPVDGAIHVAPTKLGTFTFTATITDENGKTDTATYTVTVVKAGSNITRLTLPAQIVPDTNLQVTTYPLTGLGTSSKNLPVTYSAGPASVCYVDSAKVLHLMGLGKCDVTAQSGTGALLSKDVQSFNVKKAPQTVTIIPPGTTVNGITAPAATDSSNGFKLIAPMSSGLPGVFESLTKDICLVEPDGTVTWLSDASVAGKNTCRVHVTQPGDSNFYALEDSPANTYDIVATHVASPATPATTPTTEAPIGTPRAPGTYKQGPWTITITTTKITVLGPVSSGTFIGPVIAVTKIPYTVVVKGKKVNKTQVCTIKFGLEKPFLKTDPLAWKNRITKPAVPCTLNAEAYAFYKAGNSVKLTTVVTRDRRWPTTNLNRVGDDGKGKLIPKIVSNWKIAIG